ncbi:HNH endonuclease signature motif containing protein, partial [Mycobacterium sp. E2497]|uniref:HNH endonuclease signature motif containing protein n=1 Tax=Mycobacterium sp. E2497 TaxID=1834135 RepID=UPI0009ED7D0D
MFDSKGSSVEVIAAFDEHFERRYPSKTAESSGLLERVSWCARAENRAAAAQLCCVGELFAYRLSRCGETEEWAVDTEAAVAAEIAAELRISQGMAASRVRYARAMRERLPKVGAVFKAGEIDFRMFQTLVFRTDLITDAEVLAAVDVQLAANVVRWPSLTQGRLGAQVDKIVARADADAVRRRRERAAGREVWIGEMGDGLARLEGVLFSPDAHALEARLNALAATVCAHDPRTRAQRRADGLGALAAGADRLGCRCGRADCAAGGRSPASAVVIHVLAERATLDGDGAAPGCEVRADGLIPPEVVAELAASAKLVPLVHPADAPPEQGYVPSAALADFVRCRDLTCRWPGCDCPAVACDIDHTIPYSVGGPTHASNLKCLCRTHHLVKAFWGWQEKQLPDATLILTSPAGRIYVTTPGSALLFPSLCWATGALAAPEVDPFQDYCAERTAMMPTRRRTRARDRATRVATERRQNRMARTAVRQPSDTAHYRPRDAPTDDPFESNIHSIMPPAYDRTSPLAA